MNNGIFSGFDRRSSSDTKFGYNPTGVLQFEAAVNSLPCSPLSCQTSTDGIYHLPPAQDWRFCRDRTVYLIDTTRPRVDRINGVFSTVSDKFFILTAMIAGGSMYGNAVVDWGDGIAESFSRGRYDSRVSFTHTYSNHGVYVVQVSWGSDSPTTFDNYSVVSDVNNPLIRLDERDNKLLAVLAFDHRATSLARFFMYYANCDFVPINIPPSVTNIDQMFLGTAGLYKNVELWDTKNVTSMLSTFDGFSPPFGQFSTFNADLSNWNVGNVTNMNGTFVNCSAFNNGGSSGIANWDVSKVTNMSYMFGSTWRPTIFNQPIGIWNVSNVTNMAGMFGSSENQAGDNGGNRVFNQDISNWDVSKVTNMSNMFFGAIAFNNASASGIGNWNTGACTNMNNMFRTASVFNQNISNWNVSNVTNMSRMFNNANAFQGSLSGWNLAGLNANTSLDNFMANKTGTNSYSTANYDALLIGWNNNKLAAANGVANWRTDLQPNFGGAKYTAGGAAATARAALVTYGWTITDGGIA